MSVFSGSIPAALCLCVLALAAAACQPGRDAARWQASLAAMSPEELRREEARQQEVIRVCDARESDALRFGGVKPKCLDMFHDCKVGSTNLGYCDSSEARERLEQVRAALSAKEGATPP